MSVPNAVRIARRELRGGLKGFWVFLACLTLGVAAIAAVGSVRHSIETGLEREGATILGGDAEIELTYRYASQDERAWMEANATAISEVVDFRSLAVVDRDGAVERGLTQVKAVDGAYPLYGRVELEPQLSLEAAFAGRNGVPGAVMDRVLVDRLDLAVGTKFKLGLQSFVLSAVLIREPDGASGGFQLGPRTIVRTSDLDNSGLLGPGTLFDTEYRFRVAPESELTDVRSSAEAVFQGGRWSDRRDGAPGVTEFVNRLGAFLVLVGLAGLAVGGVGISAAVRSYLHEKAEVIAVLKTLGADRRTVFLAYFFQIGVLTVLGLVLGLALGALVPLALAPLIESSLPLPTVFSVHPKPLAEAALYGGLAALLFTLWPLAKTDEVRAAALFRDKTEAEYRLPRVRWILISAIILTALVGSAAIFSGLVQLTLWSAAGIGGSFVLLIVAARAVRRLSRWLTGHRALRGRTVLRMALGSVGGPGGEATSVVLSLGLGLTVLAAVGQIDANLRGAIADNLPDIAPAYFVVDIQDAQLAGFQGILDETAGVERVESAPMLRGVITQINGRPAIETSGEHWVIEGDRGITYAAEPPDGTEITLSLIHI